MAYFRSDGWVKSVLGQAIAGAQIYVCTQPADVSYVPPIPQAAIYSDSEGLLPITQPLATDGFGHYDFYVAYGTYTVVVVTGGNIQQVYPDQTIGFTGGSGNVTSVFGRAGDITAQARGLLCSTSHRGGTLSFSFIQRDSPNNQRSFLWYDNRRLWISRNFWTGPQLHWHKNPVDYRGGIGYGN